MTSKSWTSALLAAAALGLLGMGTPAAAAEKVTYLLAAPPFLPAFGPWVLAKQRGYYDQEGLDVTFEIAKGGVDAAKQVGVGNAPVGEALGDTPIVVRANGVPVKGVALLGGGGLMQLVVREDSPIKGPADLKGKTVTVMAFTDTTYYVLLGMLAKAGLTKNDIDAQAVGPTNVWKLFLAGKSDALASVPDWEGDLMEAGAKIRVIPANRYFDSMAQIVIASDEMIEKRPDLVQKMVSATLKGWQDIVKDPDGAAVDFCKAVPQRAGQEKAMARVFRLYNEYVYPGQAKPGAFDEKRLADLQDFYLKQGIIEKATPVKELYTNQFVK